MGPQLNATRCADLETAVAERRHSTILDRHSEAERFERPGRGEPTAPCAPRPRAERPRRLPAGRSGSEAAGVVRSSRRVVPGGGSKPKASLLTGLSPMAVSDRQAFEIRRGRE